MRERETTKFNNKNINNLIRKVMEILFTVSGAQGFHEHHDTYNKNSKEIMM